MAENWWDSAPRVDRPSKGGQWWEAAPTLDETLPAAPDFTNVRSGSSSVPVAPGDPEPIGFWRAMLERSRAGMMSTVGGGVQALGESLARPYRPLRQTALAPLAEQLGQPYESLAATGAEIVGDADIYRQIGMQGVTAPGSLGDVLADPGNAARYWGGIIAESTPTMLAAMATRNPSAAAAVTGAGAGAQQYGGARAEGRTHEEAMREAQQNALIEGALSTLPFEAALGGASIPRRLATVPLLEGATESVAEGGQTLATAATRGERVSQDELGRAMLDAFVAGTGMGVGEAVLGRGPSGQPQVAPPAAPRPAALPAAPPAPLGDALAPAPRPEPEAPRAAPPRPRQEAPPPDDIDTLLLRNIPQEEAPVAPEPARAAPMPADAAPEAPLTMQNRDRSRAASVAQMQDIRRNPDPARLGFSRDTNTGAPMVARGQEIPAQDLGRTDVVVRPNGRRVPVQYAVVEADAVQASHDADGNVNPAYGGAPLKALSNGRIAGLQAAWQSGNADAYRDGIAADAAVHGVSAEAIASKRHPVLVRLYDPAENLTGAESNASQQLGLSPVEQAQTDASLLPDLSGISWAEDGTLNPVANAGFFRAWFRNLGDTASATLQDAQGRPNAAALQRVRAALVHRAYGDERLLTALVEDTNPDNRNVMNALVRAAPAFAALDPDNAVGREIRSALTGGLQMLRDAAARGVSLRDAIAQQDIFGRNADADIAAAFMAENARSARRMADAFQAMAEYAADAELQAATLDVFGTAPTPTTRAAFRRAGVETPDGRFEPAEGAPVRDEQGQPGEQAPGRTALGDAGRVAEEQPGLFGQPTAGERVDAERRRRDAVRDGRTGTGRTDMAAGDGELFAGPRPEQTTLEGERIGEQPIADRRRAARDDTAATGSDLTAIARRMGEADADRLGLREAVEKALGKAGERVIYIRDYHGLPERLRRAVEQRLEQRGGKGRPSALYDPRTQQVYVYTAVNNTPAKALRSAAHEIAGHHGLRTLLGDWLDHALNIALQNPTVKAVADAIAKQRKLRGDQRLLAAEEALAELAAVTRTGDYDLIRRAYGVEVPAGMRASVKRAVDNFLRRLKAMVDDIFGRHVFSDEDVRDLLEAAWQAAQDGPTLSVIGDDGRMTFDQVVFHGTPHNVDRFSLQKIGTGEGAQAYGWGLYFASRREVADSYRRKLSAPSVDPANLRPAPIGSTADKLVRKFAQFRVLDESDLIDAGISPDNVPLDGNGEISTSKFIELGYAADSSAEVDGGGYLFGFEDGSAIYERDGESKAVMPKQGNLYQVEIPEDSDLLDWDKPLSEQSEKVLQALSNETGVPVERYRESSRTGKQVYRTFISRRGSPEEASRRLAEIGIPGLRYLDGGSRGAGDGTHNYVIWDEAAIGEPDALESVYPNSTSITDRAAGGDSRRSANVDEVTGLPMNDDGTVTVYHHTSADRAESIRRDGLLRADAEPDVYVTTRAETDTGYGDTAVPIRVDPARLELDDEFPNGRRDFRINVGRPGGSIRVRVENDPTAPDSPGAPRVEASRDMFVPTRGDQMQTPEFRRWFGDSKVVDEQGRPLVVYRALTGEVRDGFDGGSFFAYDRGVAEAYADDGGHNVGEFYLSLQNPLILSTPEAVARAWDESGGRDAPRFHGGEDSAQKRLRDWAEAQGYDGIMVTPEAFEGEDGYREAGGTFGEPQIIAFRPEQIKSAIGNRGTFDPDNPSILESVDLTPEQQDFMRKAGLAPDTRTTRQKMLDWARGVLPDIQKDSLITGTLDAYYGLKQAVQRKGGATVETDPYIAARMINIASTMEAILRFGAPKMEGGALRVNRDVPGLFDALRPVQDNLPGFFGWMVARRAKLLKEQGREQLMSDADIQAGLSLRNGHEAAFDEAARNYLRLKNAILDFAEQHGGTIDPAARAAWDHAEYIPFYREDGEGGVAGPGTKRGLTHQSAGIRRLKGGEQNLRDPLANIIQNFTRLMDSALKNRAMQLAVDQLGDTYFKKVPPKMSPGIIPLDQVKKHLLAQGVDQATIDAMPQAALKGVAKMLTIEAPTGDNVVRVMREGKPEYYEVEDPLLLRALTAFNENQTPAWMKPLVLMKNLLTAGATSTPDFLIRNAIRDTGEAAVTARERFIPVVDTAKGAIESAMMDEFAQDLMMAGSYFHGGLFHQGQYEATSRAIKRALRRHGMGEGKAERFVKTLANPKRMWDLYRAGIEATEMGSRVSLARNRMEATGSFLEGAFEAKDFLDFTLKGDAALLQFFTRVIPFLNARLQGAYRLARAGTAKDRRRRVLARMAVMALASTALYAWNMLMHRDAYDDLEEWDKDAYWHFAPGTDYHIRLPKPFELGLLAGTAVERATAALVHAVTDGEAGDRSDQTLAALLHGITDTLAINPVPQAFKPAAEVYFNYNTFSDRPIESRGDEFLPPSERKTPHTSDFAAWVSRVLEGAVGEENALSPKQLQHLWRGYTGGMGMYLLNAADVGTRWLEGAPPKPESRLRDMPGIGALYRSGQHHTSRWVDEFYDLREVAQVQSNKVKSAMETGEPGRARNLEAEYGWLLGSREESKRAKGGFMHSGVRAIERAGREMAQLRKADRQIYESREMSPAEKRRRLDENARRRNEIAREMVRKLRARERERGR